MVDYGYLYGYGYEIYMMEFETPGFHIFKFKCSQIQVVLENKTDSYYLSTFSRQRRKVRAQATRGRGNAAVLKPRRNRNGGRLGNRSADMGEKYRKAVPKNAW